jgi:hypothetical protein
MWRIEIQQGFWHEPFVLQQYRVNRDSSLWRSTREVEKLCEYILHLEGARPMSEIYKVYCDNCNEDLTSTNIYPRYSLRVVEATRTPIPDAVFDPNAKPELTAVCNFCDLKCLAGWASEDLS